ncbi:MAG TPA: amidohydrolase family protein [Acidimicrobiia bacterium]
MEYRYVDADNHFYEAPDAFYRYGSERVRRFVQWVDQGKKKFLLFGGAYAPGNANPTFNPVAKPGAFHETLAALQRGELPTGPRYGELAPLDRAFMYRDERLAAMDEQNLERTMIYPTIGLSCEHLFAEDWDLLYDFFHAFNAWIDDDWGFDHEHRIYAPPVIPMADVHRSLDELEWAIARGCRVVTTTPGPWYGRSPADSTFDPFWRRMDDERIALVLHAYGGVPTAYRGFYERAWARPPVTNLHHSQMLMSAILPFHRPVMDSMMAMVLGGLFNRFPHLNVLSIEVGAAWVGYCLHELDHAGSNLVERRVTTFDGELVGRPSEVFKQHCYVAPFPEEDVVALAGLIGADRVLFGSDWPHPEGVAQPARFREFVATLGEAEQRMIMRDNLLRILEPVA